MTFFSLLPEITQLQSNPTSVHRTQNCLAQSSNNWDTTICSKIVYIKDVAYSTRSYYRNNVVTLNCYYDKLLCRFVTLPSMFGSNHRRTLSRTMLEKRYVNYGL